MYHKILGVFSLRIEQVRKLFCEKQDSKFYKKIKGRVKLDLYLRWCLASHQLLICGIKFQKKFVSILSFENFVGVYVYAVIPPLKSFKVNLLQKIVSTCIFHKCKQFSIFNCFKPMITCSCFL